MHSITVVDFSISLRELGMVKEMEVKRTRKSKVMYVETIYGARDSD